MFGKDDSNTKHSSCKLAYMKGTHCFRAELRILDVHRAETKANIATEATKQASRATEHREIKAALFCNYSRLLWHRWHPKRAV